MQRVLTSTIALAAVLSLTSGCGKEDKSDDDGASTSENPPVSNGGGGGDGGGGDGGKAGSDDPAKVPVDYRLSSSACKIAAGHAPSGVSIAFPRNPDRLKAAGPVKATIIMVDFSDAPATKTPAEAFAMISGATATFAEMSYGLMDYQMTPRLQWYRMSQPSTSYSFSGAGHKAYIAEAVALADADVDFSTTDSLIILTNPDASHFTQGPASVNSAGDGITADGHEMLNLVTSGNDLNEWGSIWLNHEVTHTLGLVDLYDYTPAANTLDDLLGFIGEYSYMGFNSFANRAPGLMAWERWVLGWLSDDDVYCMDAPTDGEVSVRVASLAGSAGVRAVVVRLAEHRVAVIESRRATGLDADLEKEGALAYVVDSTKWSGAGSIQVHPVVAGDPRYLTAPRAVGESVDIEGVTITVTATDAAGDVLSVVRTAE